VEALRAVTAQVLHASLLGEAEAQHLVGPVCPDMSCEHAVSILRVEGLDEELWISRHSSIV
jgi:hypothetical protein